MVYRLPKRQFDLPEIKIIIDCIHSSKFVKEKYHDEIFYNKEKKAHYSNAMLYGYDMDRTMLRGGAMNMMTHGVENPNIDYRDSLSDQNTYTCKYSIILANPPLKAVLMPIQFPLIC